MRVPAAMLTPAPMILKGPTSTPSSNSAAGSTMALG